MKKIITICLLAILLFVSCAKEETIKETSITLEEAIEIAENSDCINEGTLKTTNVYNPNSKTWWIDLEPNIPEPGCSPACVVSEETKTAEINWRCTGLIVPEE
ncbi:MAG: hypothetical protein PHT54_04035 [Candidatus Nanoarchaeia archaeon]|nr:hypothetical protein [Candidatus Nanoarchaeia archaeon]